MNGKEIMGEKFWRKNKVLNLEKKSGSKMYEKNQSLNFVKVWRKKCLKKSYNGVKVNVKNFAIHSTASSTSGSTEA